MSALLGVRPRGPDEVEVRPQAALVPTALVAALLVAGLVAGWRRIRGKAAVERADALLAAEIGRLRRPSDRDRGSTPP